MSPRAGGPFVPLNCAAIAAELIESELFGHVRGAYTGAQQSREGLFYYARGGTLFLDEIAELPRRPRPNCCACSKSGASGRSVRNRRFRSMCASSRPPTAISNAEVAASSVSARISTTACRWSNSPCRHCASAPEDLPALIQHFIGQIGLGLDSPRRSPTSRTLARMAAYDWPGNVRELKTSSSAR
jgi:transcriptional regulator of aromatic amino acid metabolism